MPNTINNQRLTNQKINTNSTISPTELVSFMGAMQAQDYEMAKWAIGTRLSQETEINIENALNNGELLRTHILRPTWHLVAPSDIRWILQLTAPQIEKITAGYYKRAELDLATRNKSNTIIEHALHEHHNLTREELMTELSHHNIFASDINASLIMFHAELTGLVCSGARKGKQISYALLDSRAPLSPNLLREEALSALATRYFQSHSPATAKDFSWWSGLSLTDARKAIDNIKNKLNSETHEKTVFYSFQSENKPFLNQTEISLLPAFDEYLVGYTDRTAALSTEFNKQAISSNGIFKPVIVHNGHVIGLWKRTRKPKFLEIEIVPFEPISDDLIMKIKEAFSSYQKYLGGIEMRFLSPT